MLWNIDPNILEFGALKLTWYGLFFMSSFSLGFLFLKYVYKKENRDSSILDNLFYYILIGAVIGARLAHCLIYDPYYYLNNPLQILAIWNGGLASHGGLAGVFSSTYLFSIKYNESYSWLISRIAIPGALSAFFIRIGNFFNSEIIGIPSDLPWAIVFSRFDNLPRHPVQLYEAFSYLILFFILLLIYKKYSFNLSTSIFLIYVFSIRFLLEFFKVSQTEILTSFYLSMGQLLSIPFIMFGFILLFNKKSIF